MLEPFALSSQDRHVEVVFPLEVVKHLADIEVRTVSAAVIRPRSGKIARHGLRYSAHCVFHVQNLIFCISAIAASDKLGGGVTGAGARVEPLLMFPAFCLTDLMWLSQVRRQPSSLRRPFELFTVCQ